MDLSTLLTNLEIGFHAAMSWNNLMWCVFGVSLGTILGVIPGIGVMVSISLLYPITLYIDPAAGVIMLAGIYYGTTYGGSTASILLNLPGTPANAVACLEGYPMAKSGRAGVALFMTTVASFVGGSIGIVLLTLFSPIIAQNALKFGSAEYFGLMLLGLLAAAMLSTGSALKGLAMICIGIVLGLIGMDIYSGTPRLTFGSLHLRDGIGIVVLAMAIFGVTEVITSIRNMPFVNLDKKAISYAAMMPTRDEWRRCFKPMLRGSAIGSFFGTLPGTGGVLASFMSYGVERLVSRDPDKFGKGAIEGLVGPETANNSSDQTAFIPTLALGIPGTATMAIILSVLVLHGITPGPRLITEQPTLFWGLIVSFWIGNLLLLILNIPMIGLWVRLLKIPYHLMYPAIIMFVCVSLYAIEHSVFQMWVLMAFGALGYVMRLLDLPPAPLLLGFVLGPLMEEHFRRAMIRSRGEFSTFIDTPIGATLAAIALALILWRVGRALVRVRKRGIEAI